MAAANQPVTEADLALLATLMRLTGNDGPFSARYSKGLPAVVCDYAVVSYAKGMEVCRIWDEAEARFYEALRNAAPELLRLARLGLLHSQP
jgi:hypothetical protein